MILLSFESSMWVSKHMCFNEIFASAISDRPSKQRLKKSNFGQLQSLFLIFFVTLRILEIECDEAVVAIVVEGIKKFSMSFYSPFSVQYSGSYGHQKIAVDFESITMHDLFKFLGPF
jgi:hypothetical protein